MSPPMLHAASRREAIATLVGVGLSPAAAMNAASKRRSLGAAGFDFLHGHWRVRHRRLKERLVGSSDWTEFEGTLAVQPFLGGLGNIDENVLDDPEGRFLATSIRVFDPIAEQWSVRWVDGRRAGLDKPVIGRFEGRVGRFYNEDEFNGRPIIVRFTYEDQTSARAHWDQAFSPDGGRTWETNWTMQFARVDR